LNYNHLGLDRFPRPFLERGDGDSWV